jgi:hypothetical protein
MIRQIGTDVLPRAWPERCTEETAAWPVLGPGQPGRNMLRL